MFACDRAPSPATSRASAPDSAAGVVNEAVQPLFDGLGDLHFAITTNSRDAQRYFDQGLMLSFAFNHAAADLAFTEAARHDPECAMCYWGSALVLGPNINAAMEADVVTRAHDLAQQALAVGARLEGKERVLIDALAKRYAAQPPTDRAPLDAAYAGAMRAAAAAYPEDVTIAALAAEALMDLHPWDYWLTSGEARPWTPEILTLLESGLQREPKHVGAMHLYIHAVEASHDATRAEGYADRLATLAPDAGHLVHMPAHIYIRTGRYHDATLANLKAAEADTRFLAACHSNAVFYRIGYVPHNYHFGWITAALEGWSAKAIELAQSTAEHMPLDMMHDPGFGILQEYYVAPLLAGVRFARWNQVLAFPAPEQDLIYARAVWYYARGRAQVAKGVLDEAEKELNSLRALLEDPHLAEVSILGINNGHDVSAVGAEMLNGELAAARGDTGDAIAHLREAVRLEDALKYNEPPDWFYPTRQALGALLLATGDAAGAEQAFEEDLRIFPENGWSLYGLAQALRAQDNAAAAAAVETRFRKAWEHADFELTPERL
jgi:tetratricopeptide (TPR) repeat protein